MLGASDPDTAGRALQQRYGFTELQATAVMEMQFRRVTALDREKIEHRRRSSPPASWSWRRNLANHDSQFE
jgi:DNA gyrase/topoisomerase IV subunit A